MKDLRTSIALDQMRIRFKKHLIYDKNRINNAYRARSPSFAEDFVFYPKLSGEAESEIRERRDVVKAVL